LHIGWRVYQREAEISIIELIVRKWDNREKSNIMCQESLRIDPSGGSERHDEFCLEDISGPGVLLNGSPSRLTS
jgi:hypothetical protein